MSLYEALVNRFVMPVIEAHKAQGRAQGLEIGQAEWREWNQRRMDAKDQGRSFDEPPPAGWAEDFERGRAKERAKWVEWNRRLMDAEAHGRPFDEPPPGGWPESHHPNPCQPNPAATAQRSTAMPRVALDLESKDDLAVIQSDGWRVAPGLEPGEPNQGLVAEKRGSNARLPDYDDSGWESGADIQQRYSIGFTFAWYRLRFTLPATVKGQDVAQCRVWFETNVDNYGEVYIDGKIDRNIGVITGNNTPKRVLVEEPGQPGGEHLIAVLVANAPLGEPVGAIFMRYATLAFETQPPR